MSSKPETNPSGQPESSVIGDDSQFVQLIQQELGGIFQNYNITEILRYTGQKLKGLPGPGEKWTAEQLMSLYPLMKEDQERSVRIGLASEYLLILETMDEKVHEVSPEGAQILQSVRDISYLLLKDVVASPDNITDEVPDESETVYEAEYLEVIRRKILHTSYVMFGDEIRSIPSYDGSEFWKKYYAKPEIEQLAKREKITYDQAQQKIVTVNISALSLVDWEALARELEKYTIDYLHARINRYRINNEVHTAWGIRHDPSGLRQQREGIGERDNQLIEQFEIVKNINELADLVKAQFSNNLGYQELLEILNY
jgi:hypothetical protein